jgi:hypothetical protein
VHSQRALVHYWQDTHPPTHPKEENRTSPRLLLS